LGTGRTPSMFPWLRGMASCAWCHVIARIFIYFNFIFIFLFFLMYGRCLAAREAYWDDYAPLGVTHNNDPIFHYAVLSLPLARFC
jgi:hypothetical protein